MAKKGKVASTKTHLRDVEGDYYHKAPSTLLDNPLVEDVFTRDLTNSQVNVEKTGWKPSWSRYTQYGRPNETREAREKHAKTFEDGYEGGQDDNDVDSDYRDRTAFTPTYR